MVAVTVTLTRAWVRSQEMVCVPVTSKPVPVALTRIASWAAAGTLVAAAYADVTPPAKKHVATASDRAHARHFDPLISISLLKKKRVGDSTKISGNA